MKGHDGFLGHRRDKARGEVCWQPGISYGGTDGKRFTVVHRTDGTYVVADAERPWNDAGVPGAVRDTCGEADLIAQRLAGLHPGAPFYETQLRQLADGGEASPPPVKRPYTDNDFQRLLGRPAR